MKVEYEILSMLPEKSELDAKLREMTEQYRNIRDWAEVFDTASPDEKMMILARIIRKITVDRNYAITIYFILTLDDFKKAFEDDRPEMVETVENVNPQRVLA